VGGNGENMIDSFARVVLNTLASGQPRLQLEELAYLPEVMGDCIERIYGSSCKMALFIERFSSLRKVILAWHLKIYTLVTCYVFYLDVVFLFLFEKTLAISYYCREI
jgi:hypothetical protein